MDGNYTTPMIHGPPRKISDLYISPSQEKKKNPCPLDLKIYKLKKKKQ